MYPRVLEHRDAGRHTLVVFPGYLALVGAFIAANPGPGAIRGRVGSLAGFYKDAHLRNFVVENVSMALVMENVSRHVRAYIYDGIPKPIVPAIPWNIQACHAIGKTAKVAVRKGMWLT